MAYYNRIEENLLFTWLEVEMTVEFELDEDEINICSVIMGSGENEVDITKALTDEQVEEFKNEIREKLTEMGEAEIADRADWEYEQEKDRRLQAAIDRGE